MRLVKQGAEARIFLGTYLGRKCIVKIREPKIYREKALDEKIIKERMRTECGMLSRAKKAGVRTPAILKIDLKERTIITEFIEGKTLKEELLKSGKGKTISDSEVEKLCTQMGKMIAKLHCADLVHGDLTTSNIILHNGKLVFIDFGMGEVSSKVESKAVDLLVLRKTFAATHFKIMEKWEAVERAYCAGFEGAKDVLEQMAQVEARARYY
ncbi:MAG TPA: KEOPS complex kinase/ATPase Bud32 [archaeon]|nr:KEOPS complex kinase/ATPase Bud32 [archaeon]